MTITSCIIHADVSVRVSAIRYESRHARKMPVEEFMNIYVFWGFDVPLILWLSLFAVRSLQSLIFIRVSETLDLFRVDEYLVSYIKYVIINTFLPKI